MVIGEPKRNIMEGIENTGDVRLHDHRLRLKQRFDIIRKLGQGTYGKVQLGINKKTGQEVAIKTIKKCKIETEADLVRIRREVQIMSSVRHPNIVHIYEVFENSEKMILVMEYCAGGELYDYLSQQKVLQEDEARRLFRQIATAVYYCHKHKICHRDLKLENVLLDEHGSAKIADFGLSNVFEERRLLSTFCGSPLYASPEIVKGTPYIGPEVDCWSLGVLLYTLVYGAMPFDGSNFKRLVKQISTGDYFEPKNPSSASSLIREMLTVDPNLRADIPHICDHSWVNKGSDVSCLELAEVLANATPVRLDLLLSLAPPPSIDGDKLLVTDEVTQIGPDGSPSRSMSVANIDTSAERRILEMVAEGGTDAIKPSPTRTIMSSEQPKRKLETTVSMDSAPSQRKKERMVRSSSGSKQNLVPNDSDVTIIPYVENNGEASMTPDNDSLEYQNSSLEVENKLSPDVNQIEELNNVPPRTTSPASPTISKNMSQLTLEIANDNAQAVVPKSSPEKSTMVNNAQANKELKPEPKVKEKSAVPKPTVVKKKIVNSVKKDDKQKPEATKEKTSPQKTIEKDITGRVIVSDKKPEEKKEVEPRESSPTKQPERRRSRILDAAEKLNNLNIQPTHEASPPTQPPVKPKKVLIPGVSVGSFKEQFERRASLTSSNVPVTANDLKKTGSKTVQGNAVTTNFVSKPATIKKINSVDSEHPQVSISNNQIKEQPVKLETIGVEPSLPPKEEPAKPLVEVKKPAIVEIYKVPKVLHKSESLREAPRRDQINNSMSLEDARRSLQQSMALLSQAKSESKQFEKQDDQQNDRQKQLKTAREIISNAIGEDGKKINRICTGAKPPMPYGSGGRNYSGTLSLSSLNSLPTSPPISPPHAKPFLRESPAKTFRTEVQHKVDDVRNKFLPSSRGSSVERIIPIHYAEEQQKTNLNNSPSGQLPYQRNNTMPYRLHSVPRTISTTDNESDTSSQPSTPSTVTGNSKAEPIRKSPREFIIPIAVEGKGYVTPRQGSVEPSDIPSKMTPSNIGFASRFPKPRRITSIMSGGESEDEDDMHMHRLRSSRKVKVDPEKDSVSSGEEDDDEGYELLTADNLFSTLLHRVRSLTNRLKGEEGTGFSDHHQSLFNNLHSPFFNSPHLPRKHKKHNLIIHKIKTEQADTETREGPSWRRSTSRDITNDFDSMFPSHTPFPRGSKKSRKAAAAGNKSDTKSQKTDDSDRSDVNANNSESNSENLDLSDLDLSKIELSEKDVETLSGLTPALSRRLQKQLLEHLPPAAARSLRRTLSMNCPNGKTGHQKYTRSLSASKTTNNQTSLLEENDSDNFINNNTNTGVEVKKRNDDGKTCGKYDSKRYSYDDDDSSSVSTLSRQDRDFHHESSLLKNFETSTTKSNQSIHSIDLNCNKFNSSSAVTSRGVSSVRSTPDRSVLSKYFSPDRNTCESNLLPEVRIKADSPCYPGDGVNSLNINQNNLNNDTAVSPRRRFLGVSTPTDTTPRKRISRFLRPDFFDTPREESIYCRDKLDKESETQQVLKEIREKRNRNGGISPCSSYLRKEDMPSYDTSSSRLTSKYCMSPTSPSTPNRSRSTTPFYPILDNIHEVHSSHNLDSNFVSSKRDKSPMESYRIDKYPDAQTNLRKVESENLKEKIDTNSILQNVTDVTSEVQRESKIARPKSYPLTSPIEIVTNDIPICAISRTSDTDKSNTIKNETENKSQFESDDNGNISVSFNVSLPTKQSKPPKTDERYPHDITTTNESKEAKKSPTKKKIIVKKKSSSQKSLLATTNGKTPKDGAKDADASQSNNNTDNSNMNGAEQKTAVVKKKSVLQSIGQKFEKLRNDGFTKGNSQEKEQINNKTPNDVAIVGSNEADNTVERLTRTLREQSVPALIQTEPITESGLIKRAVTITNLSSVDSPDSQSKKSVSRVLGLFKKMESKDKSKPPTSNLNLNATDVASIKSTTENAPQTAVVENKPKRPTSLLLNGIGKRVQACYVGATSDSELIKKDKKPPVEKNCDKAEDSNKVQKKGGLRLDFSRLPKLNQNIFNKRNSSESLKVNENKYTNANSDQENVDAPLDAVENIPDVPNGVVDSYSSKQECTSNGTSVVSNGSISSPAVVDWSPDFDSSAISKSENSTEIMSPQTDNDLTPEAENIIDRIRRKSFYSRFNEKKNRRKSSLVGPGAKEYVPSARINPQSENDETHYSSKYDDPYYFNKYDLSPTSPSKYGYSSVSNYDHGKHLHSADKSDYLSSPKIRSTLGHDCFAGPSSLDRYDVDVPSYSSPRYQRTLSYFDDVDSRSVVPLESKTSASRYGRTLSLLSPGIYATYSPRSHTRNPAILLRDDDDVTPEDVLAKIRSRKKSAVQNTSYDEPSSLDTKFRSNNSHHSENEPSTNRTD